MEFYPYEINGFIHPKSKIASVEAAEKICDCCRSKQTVLKQIKSPISLYTCAPINQLPSNNSTMTLPVKYYFACRFAFVILVSFIHVFIYETIYDETRFCLNNVFHFSF